MHVLIVDDDPMVAESCRRILGAEEIRVTVAGSVAEAKAALASDDSFDLMLTDIKMPKSDGFQLVEMVREKYPDLRILIMTGYLTPETTRRGRTIGAYGFVEKPFTPDELIAAVQNAGK